MKTNQKQLKLIQYGLRPSTVTNLTESQVNLLFKKLLESKKETKEQKGTVSVKGADVNKIKALTDQGINVQVTETEMVEDMDAEINMAMSGITQDPKQKGPTGDGDLDSIEEEIKRLVEKFESKKQQKYFFAKCGDGKTKEQKKWCKMAEEFASKTKNIKKLPPKKKKKETKESGMSNFNDKVLSAYAGGLKEKLNKINIKPTFESELERKIMRLVEKHITPKMTKKEFLNLVKEQGTKTAPVKPDIDTPTKPSKPATPYKPKPGVKPAPKAGKEAPVKPGVKPDVDTPTRPSKPATPYKPKPGVKPAPKAGRESMPTWLTFDEIGINLK